VPDIAVQLYTLRKLLDEDLEGTLARLAEAGARDVELAGLHGRSGATMRAALDHAGLVAVSAHIGIERFEQEPDAVLAETEALGTSTLVVPWVQPPQTAAEADATVDRIEAAGAATRGAGLGFAYHNHDFEFRALDDGTTLWSRLLETDLDLEPDVGWLRVAGHDPVAALRGLGGRCRLVHAKDMRKTSDGGWEDVPAGDGELDWPAIAAAARAAGAGWLVVELDNPAPDAVPDVARSLETLRAALGA
jgi:sugar phosphate isomerase/epimerase